MKSAPVSLSRPGIVRTLVLAVALVALLAPGAFAADGYLGVHIQDLDETLAAALDLEDDAGVLVSKVVEDSPAEAAGLKQGDLILTINGREAVDSERFTRRVRRIDAGESATLEILRKGRSMSIAVTLAEAPEDEFSWSSAPHVKTVMGDAMFFGEDDPVVVMMRDEFEEENRKSQKILYAKEQLKASGASAEAVGVYLGVGGCMESLVRFRSGAFPLEEAASLDEIVSDPEPARLLREASSGLGFPVVEFDDETLMQFIGGKEIPCPDGIGNGLVSITRKGRLIALAAIRDRDGERLLGPRRVLEPNLKELLKQTDK